MKFEEIAQPIEIRQATMQDLKRLIPAMRFVVKKVNYINYIMLKLDITNSNCFVLEQNNKIIAVCSLVFDNRYQMYYLKRFTITNKINLGKGYGKTMIRGMLKHMPNGAVIAATPWVDNMPMKRLLEGLGFELRYQIDDNFVLYTTTIK